MKKLIAMVLALMMLLSLTACGGEQEADKITIVLDWTPNTNHTGIYAALANGYFEEAGLNVEVVQPPEDGAVALVASGRAQFGVSFQDYLAPAYVGEDKMPVTAVATCAVFVVYDLGFSRLVAAYCGKMGVKIRQIFRFQ